MMRLHPRTPLRSLLLLSLAALLALSANPIAGAQPTESPASRSGLVEVVWNHTVSGYVPHSLRLPSPVATSVGFVCVYPDLGSVSLVNPSTFSAAWTFRVESTPSQVVVGGGVVYVVTEWGRVYGIRLLDGAAVFDPRGVQVDGIDASVAPAYASGVVALPAGRGVVGLNGATGRVEWRVKLPWRVLLVLSGGGKLVVGHTSGVSAIDPVTGTLLWNATLGSPVRAAAIVGPSVLAVNDAGTLHELDLATGGAGRSLKLPTPDPAPGKIKTGPDILYVVTKRARVYPVGLRSFRVLDIVYLDQNPVAQPEIANHLMLAWTVQGVLLGVPAVPSPVDVVFEYPAGARFISGVGFDPVSQVAMFYLSDGRLVALRVPLYSVQVADYRAEDRELSADLILCAFPGTKGVVKLLAKNELGVELFSETVEVHGAGCFLRSASFDVGASREVSFVLSGMGLQSPPATVELAAGPTPPPPAEPGMAVGAPPSLVVGESAEIPIAVTNGWKDGLAYVSVDCEGLEKVRSEEGYVAVGASRTFTLALTPKRPGEISCRAALVIGAEVVHEEEFTLKAERGSVIEGAPQVSPQEVKEGEKFTVRLTLVNRYEDGAIFTVGVSGPGVTGGAVQVGPLAAGEEREVEVSGRATGAGSKDLTITASVGSALVDSLTLPRAVSVIAPRVSTAPPPTTAPPGPGILSRLPEPFRQYAPFIVGGIAAVAAVSIAIRARRAPSPGARRVAPPPPPRPRPAEIREEAAPQGVVEEAPPAPGAPKPEVPAAGPGVGEVAKPERPAAEERPSGAPERVAPTRPPTVSAGELSSAVGRLRESLRRIVAEAKGLEGEGLVGIDERAAVVERRLARAEVLIDIEDLEEAQKVVREVEESVKTLEDTVRQFREVLMGEVWPSVEKRIATMLRVWGRAPASMLTMIPSELRVAALARFAKLHPEMRLELRGDELYAEGEGA